MHLLHHLAKLCHVVVLGPGPKPGPQLFQQSAIEGFAETTIWREKLPFGAQHLRQVQDGQVGILANSRVDDEAGIRDAAGVNLGQRRALPGLCRVQDQAQRTKRQKFGKVASVRAREACWAKYTSTGVETLQANALLTNSVGGGGTVRSYAMVSPCSPS